MNRTTGTGFMAFGLVLVVVGAVMRFAVTVHTTGFNIHAAGVIALWVGVVTFVVGLLLMALGGRQQTTRRQSVVETPAGQERVEEQDTWTS
jgi:protein-S-isoprenylcysteine O-methyltransferase Ste14